MFLVCGEALFDLFIAGENGPGELRFEARAGGSPFNVAIGIARLGGTAGLFTGLSWDLLGARLDAMLQDEGVDTRYLVRSGRRTTLSVVGADANGQPAYAFYGVGSADCALEVSDLPELADGVCGLHLGSYSIVVPPVADTLAALVEREQRRFVSLDPNVRPTIEPDMGVWRARIDALLPRVDMVKVSAEDLDLMHPGVAPEAVAQRWLACGPRLVVITDSGREARACTARETVSVAIPETRVVDTVGAGDTFQAALLWQLSRDGDPAGALAALRGSALEALLAFAARAAAITCSRRGADLPRASDLPITERAGRG